MAPSLRVATEHLLRPVFATARLAFLAQALGIGLAVAFAPLRAMFPEHASWLADVGRSMMLLAGVFAAGTVLLFVVPRLVPPPGGTARDREADALAGRTPDAGGGDASSRRASDAAASRGSPAPVAVALIGWSLLALPIVAAVASGELFALWREILDLLRRADLEGVVRGGGSMGGIVFAPILAVLYVPALELAAAAFLALVPLGVLVLFHARSHRFRRMLVMMVVCQAALVAASLVGADLFARVAAVVERVPEIAADAEARPWLERLRHAVAVLRSTSLAHLGVTLAFLAGAPLLLRASEPFVAGSGEDAAARDVEARIAALVGAPVGPVRDVTGPMPTPSAARASSIDAPDLDVASSMDLETLDARRSAAPWAAESPAARETLAAPADDVALDPQAEFQRALQRVRARAGVRADGGPRSYAEPASAGLHDLAPVAALLLGAALLIVGACDSVLPRVRFADANPAPGATLNAPPAAVIVRFTQPLGAGSRLTVYRSYVDSDEALGIDAAPGEVAASTFGPGAPTLRALSAAIPATVGRGVYRVDWRAAPAGTGVLRSGHYYFGIGRSVPDVVAGDATAFAERDVGQRRRRATLLGGVLLLGLGALIPAVRRVQGGAVQSRLPSITSSG